MIEKDRRHIKNRPGTQQDIISEDTADHDIDADEGVIEGRQAVREALRSNRQINKLLYSSGELDSGAKAILALAAEKRIVTQSVDRRHLDEISRTSRHQGFIAYAAAHGYVTVDDILSSARIRGEEPFVIVLDGITDPHNLGSIIRSADAMGVHGVIIPKRRAVGITPAVVKASAGAVEYVPVARVTNINAALDELKKAGLWIFAAAADARPVTEADLRGPIALVIGGEGEGISPLTAKHCDFTVSIPQKGNVGSLNASVAAAVIMFEISRQRSLNT